MCVYVCECKHACVVQKTILDVSPHLLTCLKQGLLSFDVASVRLTGPRASGESPVHLTIEGWDYKYKLLHLTLHGFWESELRSLELCNGCFNHWALSPASTSNFKVGFLCLNSTDISGQSAFMWYSVINGIHGLDLLWANRTNRLKWQSEMLNIARLSLIDNNSSRILRKT